MFVINSKLITNVMCIINYIWIYVWLRYSIIRPIKTRVMKHSCFCEVSLFATLIMIDYYDGAGWKSHTNAFAHVPHTETHSHKHNKHTYTHLFQNVCFQCTCMTLCVMSQYTRSFIRHEFSIWKLCISYKLHSASKETYHSFRATLTKIRRIKKFITNHLLTKIS